MKRQQTGLAKVCEPVVRRDPPGRQPPPGRIQILVTRQWEGGL
jgi:hypothetical protein